MLSAAIKDCPVQGGKIKSFDATRFEHARRQEGGAGRRLGCRGGGGYLVAGQDRARGAVRRLGRWREQQGLERNDRRMAQGRSRRSARRSSATRTATPRVRIASAAKKVEAVYAYPYQNHAPMEPMNATALYTADKCEVWGPTQNGEAAFAAALAASGLPAEQVDVTTARFSEAASAGAAPSRITSRRPCSSPSRCRARR